MNWSKKIMLLTPLFIFVLLIGTASFVYAWGTDGEGGGCCGGDSGWGGGDDWGWNDSGGADYGWGSDPTPTPPVPTCSISASKTVIYKGESSTLSFSSSNASSASINNGVGSVSTSGSKTVSPNSTTTYTMTVSGAGGYANCSVTVTVKPLPTCSISASKTVIYKGESSTLSFSSSNASSASINNGVGSVSTSGSKTVSPNSTTTYTMTVKSGTKSSTCKVKVTVKPLPACSLSISPSAITQGENATLTWTSQNATVAEILGIGTVGLNGSYTVSNLQSTKTYKMTVKNSDGKTATCSAKVTVNKPQVPAPSCSIRVTPSTIDEGDDVTLVWSTSNAVSARISDGIGSVALAGSKTIYNLKATERYTMTVENSEGETATCSAIVKVNQKDLSCNIYASPNPSTDGTTTLNWSSSNAVWAMINNGIGTVSTDGSKTLTNLSNGTHVYTMTVGSSHSGGKTKTCSVTVNVNKTVAPSPAPSCSITASRTYIQKGEGTTLYWTSQNATSAIFADNGNVATSGSRVVYPTASGYYKLIVTNQDGQQSTCQTYITVENPMTVVTVSSVPYTGPNDAIYVGIMALVFSASVFGLYRRRNQVLELVRG